MEYIVIFSVIFCILAFGGLLWFTKKSLNVLKENMVSKVDLDKDIKSVKEHCSNELNKLNLELKINNQTPNNPKKNNRLNNNLIVNKQKKELAPLVNILAGKFFGIIIFLIFCLFALLNNNEFLPSNWHPLTIYWYVSLNLLILLIYAGILSDYGVFNAEHWLSNITNVNCYNKLTKLDSVLAHYTNVATIGLFIGILVFTGKQFSINYPRTVALLATILIFIIFGLYAVLYARLAMRFAKEKTFALGSYFIITLTIFGVDSIAIRMFIKAVPEIG